MTELDVRRSIYVTGWAFERVVGRAVERKLERTPRLVLTYRLED
jgi:hypothetical protein